MVTVRTSKQSKRDTCKDYLSVPQSREASRTAVRRASLAWQVSLQTDSSAEIRTRRGQSKVRGHHLPQQGGKKRFWLCSLQMRFRSYIQYPLKQKGTNTKISSVACLHWVQYIAAVLLGLHLTYPGCLTAHCLRTSHNCRQPVITSLCCPLLVNESDFAPIQNVNGQFSFERNQKSPVFLIHVPCAITAVQCPPSSLPVSAHLLRCPALVHPKNTLCRMKFWKLYRQFEFAGQTLCRSAPALLCAISQLSSNSFQSMISVLINDFLFLILSLL